MTYNILDENGSTIPDIVKVKETFTSKGTNTCGGVMTTTDNCTSIPTAGQIIDYY